ncbi:MAG: cobalamin-independent methionine synthase II family protein [Verrucomicrobiales bacterium]|nr:cobalamin-independent methionine synthase II family protein [Verrucomicrobiales bacterium]
MIRTTTVGSYAPIDWLLAGGATAQAVTDATAVVIATQRRAGIDLPTDGELYRYDPSHPDTNGMIEYFTRQLGGIDSQVGVSDARRFREKQDFLWRRHPAGVVREAITEGTLDLATACARSQSVAGGPLKFTLTSPYMLARTLLDDHYGDFDSLCLAIGQALADQVADLDCACVQVDEANIPGSPENAPIAAAAINLILDRVRGEKAVHFCFGNYGGQTIQRGEWAALVDFLNALHTDHLILELAHRPHHDLEALRDIDPRIGLGIGVIDIKVNHIETPDEVARRLDTAARTLGIERLAWAHPDCGFWMLKRSIADRKIEALAKGNALFLGSLG